MERTFGTSRHPLFWIIFVLLPGLAVGVFVFLSARQLFEPTVSLAKKMLFVAMAIGLGWLGWRFSRIFFETRYTVDDSALTYHCGWNSGRIPIDRITHFRKATYPAAGNRPAMDLNGVEIFYGEGYSVFVTPEKTEEFIRCLQYLKEISA